MISIPTMLLIFAAALGVGCATRFLIVGICFAGVPISSLPTLPTANKKSVRKPLRDVVNTIGDVSPISAREAGTYRDKLNSAGLRLELKTWRGIQIVCLCIALLVAASLLLQSIDLVHLLFACALVATGVFGPNAILVSLARDRRKRIDASIASSLELLSITVKSGYPLERGIRLVGMHTSGPLADEFRAVDADINLLGMSMERALKRMEKRCDTPSVRSFTTALIQASNQGTSISRVLDSQARIARNEHFASLTVQVNKLPAKLVAPIFGIMMLIIVLALTPPIFETVSLFTDAYGGTDLSEVSTAIST